MRLRLVGGERRPERKSIGGGLPRRQHDGGGGTRRMLLLQACRLQSMSFLALNRRVRACLLLPALLRRARLDLPDETMTQTRCLLCSRSFHVASWCKMRKNTSNRRKTTDFAGNFVKFFENSKILHKNSLKNAFVNELSIILIKN